MDKKRKSSFSSKKDSLFWYYVTNVKPVDRKYMKPVDIQKPVHYNETIKTGKTRGQQNTK